MADPVGPQQIRWRQWVDQLITKARLPATRSDVTSRWPDGAQRGYNPGAMPPVTAGVPNDPPAPVNYPAIYRRGRVAIVAPDIHSGNDQMQPAESSDVLWFSGSAGLPAWAQRFQAGRHTQEPITADATHKSHGSSAQRSGPEGTLVLYPPHMPRMMATRRAISPNTASRAPVQRVATPQISVVQAAGWYP